MLWFTSAVVVHQHKLCSPNQNKIHAPNQNKIHGVGGFWLYPQGHVCDLLYDCHDLLRACEKMLPSGKRDDLYCWRPSCFVTWHDNNYLPSITAIHYFLIITICSKMMMIDYLPCGWLKLLFCFDSGLSTSMYWLPRLPFRFLFSSQTLKSSSKGFDKALLTKVLVSPW